MRAGSRDLFPSRRKFRVPSDAALDIVVALSVPTQVDRVRVHVDVHEVVDDLALDVVLHPVHQETSAHVHHLDKRQVPAGGDEFMLVNQMFVYCHHLVFVF